MIDQTTKDKIEQFYRENKSVKKTLKKFDISRPTFDKIKEERNLPDVSELKDSNKTNKIEKIELDPENDLDRSIIYMRKMNQLAIEFKKLYETLTNADNKLNNLRTEIEYQKLTEIKSYLDNFEIEQIKKQLLPPPEPLPPPPQKNLLDLNDPSPMTMIMLANNPDLVDALMKMEIFKQLKKTPPQELKSGIQQFKKIEEVQKAKNLIQNLTPEQKHQLQEKIQERLKPKKKNNNLPTLEQLNNETGVQNG